MKSIRYLSNKIKLIIETIEKENFFIVLIIILLSSASFGLGRLSKMEENKSSLHIENLALVSQQSEQNQQTGKYVASKSGSKYHLPWCSGAQTISEKNKIWFNSKEEAENMGYTPAKNCKGI